MQHSGLHERLAPHSLRGVLHAQLCMETPSITDALARMQCAHAQEGQRQWWAAAKAALGAILGALPDLAELHITSTSKRVLLSGLRLLGSTSL